MSEHDCIERANLGRRSESCSTEHEWGHASQYGSSRCWPPDGLPPADGGPHGMFGSDPNLNPMFHDFTVCALRLASGSSLQSSWHV